MPEEQSSVYNTMMTGRLYPQKIQKQDVLYAGMRVPESVSSLRIQVSAREVDSYLALLDGAIKQTHREKAPLETATKKLLRYFIPTVLALAAISAVAMSFFFTPAIAIQCAASVLVAACPCTFGLVTPLAIQMGIGKAAEYGVHIKSVKHCKMHSRLIPWFLT